VVAISSLMGMHLLTRFSKGNETMKKATAVVLFLSSTAIAALAFSVWSSTATGQTPSNGGQGPSLAETISFMDKSVQPEVSNISSVNSCEVYVARNRTYMFALPTGVYVKSTDQLGVPHTAFNWMVVEEPAMTRFNFATIDPKSINSKAVPSPPFLKEHDVDENPSELKNADLMLVSFETTNSYDAIETGHLGPPGNDNVAAPIFDHHAKMGFIVFESKDRAERFVTAFVHAVELCGGRASDFAPTPSKP
jgi:hypothetical protein